ncbi:mechanosensitive ion channel domain-containing protein [Wenzhouxiangella sp. EGI_FJ10305]|uniref:mechanosensitive ion channel domain-containing protein n=1 Tax=Wenzhouxiangella sp. EGI_FJ10305 TaxID=3243768 RepID=UPI0035DC467A
MDWLPNFSIPDSAFSLIISTAILVFAIAVVRGLTARYIRHNVAAAELRRKWLVNSRNGLLLLLLLGLVLIWGNELRTLALSIVAIAIAFVVATKELILCLTGSLLKSGSSAFSLGDRIQVKDFRGDVIDHSLLATTILEVGPGNSMHQRTGRKIVLPNALFVSEPIVNESFTEKYGFHILSIPFKREDDWNAARQALIEAAERHCAPFINEVRMHMSRVSELRGLGLPPVEPRVTIHAPNATEVQLVVRLPVPAGQRSTVEQAILDEVLSGKDYSAAGKP